VDTDAVVKVTGNRLPNYLHVLEAEFQLESEVLAQVCAYTNLAIATGGGIVLRRENWSYLPRLSSLAGCPS